MDYFFGSYTSKVMDDFHDPGHLSTNWYNDMGWGYFSLVHLGMPENLWHYWRSRLHEHLVVVIVLVAVAVLPPKIELSQQVWEGKNKKTKHTRIKSAGQF